MNFQLDNFLQAIQGDWLSQKTTHYLIANKISSNQLKSKIRKSKAIKSNYQNDAFDSHKHTLKFFNLNTKQNEYYAFLEPHQKKFGILQIKKDKDLYSYNYEIYSNNCLKIQYIQNNIEYIEFIHNINSNFTTQMVFLKQSDKYIAISFSSNIKMKETDNI